MNKHYIIWPILMIGLFIGYHYQWSGEHHRQEEANKEAKKIDDAKKEEDRKARVAQAQKEADERQAKEKAESDARVAARVAKQEDADQKVRNATADARKAADELAKKKGVLEADLAEARRKREKTETEVFALVKEIELMKIDRRNAENEIQRAAEFIANKVDATSLVEIPVFAAPKPAPAAPK